MACSSDFIQYIVDQCSGAGSITVRKMMGDYCIYCDGVLFGLICDNSLFIKITSAGCEVLEEVVMRPPYEGAKDYFFIGDVDDREYITRIVRATVSALVKSNGRSNPMVERVRQVPASLDDTIQPGLVCSQELRAFFVRYLGPGFRYKVEFQEWLRANAGKTFREAVEVYPTLKRRR